MMRPGSQIRYLCLVLAMAAGGSLLTAQNAAKTAFGSSSRNGSPAQGVQGDVVRELHPRATPSPFPLDGRGGSAPALEFRSPEQMTAADRELAEASQMEIARRAGLQGFGIALARTSAEEEIGGKSDWGYEQAVCPVFPDHLILEYSRIEVPGVVTLFSVAIPRASAIGGHVRVIPVRRRGYSLWTPSASNALTLNDFNHMVAEGGRGVSPDWLTLGLCYAALAGGHVRAALVAAMPADEKYPLFAPAMLTVSARGGAQVQFIDIAHYAEAKAKAMDWVLTFAENGRLEKVRHTVAGEVLAKPLAAAVNQKPVRVLGEASEFSKPAK